MKTILILCFSLLSLGCLAQTDSLKHKQQLKDSLTLVLEKELNVKKEKVEKVLTYIEQSNGKMKEIAQNKMLKGEEKINRFKQIAQERDQKIRELLDEEQVKKLQLVMASQRQKENQQQRGKP